MQRVPDQHHILERPVLVPDPGKIAPHRFVRHQRVPAQRVREHGFANGLGLLDRLVGKAIALPGGAIAFDQERAHVGRVSVVMRVESAEIGLDKGLRQRLEPFRRAVPREFVGGVRHRGAEIALERAAHQRVEAIRRDDQIIARQLIHRRDQRVVARRDTDGADALLQNAEQIEPADRGKPDAVDLDALAAQIERDVVPALHPRRDGVDRFRIVGAQKFERLLGEHHAKPPRGAGGILLEQIDPRVRMTLLPQISEIETAGASADHGDAHMVLQWPEHRLKEWRSRDNSNIRPTV